MCCLLPCKSEHCQIPFPAGGTELQWLLSGMNPSAGPESWNLGIDTGRWGHWCKSKLASAPDISCSSTGLCSLTVQKGSGKSKSVMGEILITPFSPGSRQGPTLLFSVLSLSTHDPVAVRSPCASSNPLALSCARWPAPYKQA